MSPVVDTMITGPVQDYLDLGFDNQYHMLYNVYPTAEMIPRRRLIFRTIFFCSKLSSKRFTLTMINTASNLRSERKKIIFYSDIFNFSTKFHTLCTFFVHILDENISV
jgi:hypothetical protein